MVFPSMFSNTLLGLIELLKHKKVIKSQIVENVMKLLDRKDFISKSTSDYLAYSDKPLPIGFGATISAPHMHAYALELLKDTLRPKGK